MKTIIKMIAVWALTMVLTIPVMAQEWTKEQTEVWNVVKSMWSSWQKGDSEAISMIFHDKYQGWSNEAPLPSGKETALGFFDSMKEVMKINFYNIEPARITVLKNAAVVNYYCSFSYSYSGEGETKSDEVKGKIVEFYVNEGGKWQLLGDMMVNEDNNDD